jgi:hypothetical protein
MGDRFGLSTRSEEYRLKTFVNRLVRRIFGPKRKEVAGD